MTAYDIRIIDLSSDVCSSDLLFGCPFLTQALGWVFAVICAVCAPVLIVLSFVMPDSAAAGGIRISLAQFLIPVVLSWIALFPRSTREWQNLRKGHPLVKRYFGGKPAGFFVYYRRKSEERR